MTMIRVLAIAAILTAFGATAPTQGTRITGKVIKVADGDTLTLRVGTDNYVIRLAGIDSPEDGQDFSKVAKQALVRRALDQEVRVLVTDRDKYGRTVGIVYLDGECINTELVKAGLAWHYVEYSDSKVLAKAEQSAREKKLGLWADAHPMPPWEWRNKHAEEMEAKKAAAAKARDESVASAKARAEKARLAEESRSRERASSPTTAGSYWLNTSTNVRHNSSCRYHHNTKHGRSCGPNDGKACGICGG